MNSNLVQVNWDTRENVLFTKLNALRIKEIHTDITLSCDGENYPAHRLILSMSSGYFARTFEANREISPSIILICGIQAPILQALLSFIYDGTTTIKSEDVHLLLKAGIMLEIPGLMEMGSNYLTRESEQTLELPQDLRVSSVSIMSELEESEAQLPHRNPSTIPRETTISSSYNEKPEEIFPQSSSGAAKINDSDDSISFEGWDNSTVHEMAPLLKERKIESSSKEYQSFSPASSSTESQHSEKAKISNTLPLSFFCSECSKSFYVKRLYTLHMRSHKSKVKVKREPDCSMSVSNTSTDSRSHSHGMPSFNEAQKKGRNSPVNFLKCKTTNMRTSSVDQGSKRLKSDKDLDMCNSIDEILYTVSESFKNSSDGQPFHNDDSIYDTFNGHSPIRATASGENSIVKPATSFSMHSPGKSSSSLNSHSSDRTPSPTIDGGRPSTSLIVKNEKQDPSSNTNYDSAHFSEFEEFLKNKFSLDRINKRVCNSCDFPYLNTRNYKRHRTRDCKVLECQFCLKSFDFKDRSNYEKHVSTHKTMIRPYSCPHCAYCTDSKRSFEDHSSLHTGIFRFWCLLCDNFQTRKMSDLKDHLVCDHPEVDLTLLNHIS